MVSHSNNITSSSLTVFFSLEKHSATSGVEVAINGSEDSELRIVDVKDYVVIMQQ